MRSVEAMPASSRPPIRVRPVPRCDPPFDDELAPEARPHARQLTLDWSVLPGPVGAGATGPGAVEAGAVGPGAVGAGATGPGAVEAGAVGPGAVGAGTAGSDATRSGASATGTAGDARLAVRRFVRVCVEVLNGYRPAAHLRRFSAPQEAAGVVAQGVAGARRIAELRRSARAGDRPARRPGPVAVLNLRLCEPRPGAVEAAVLLVTGRRTWAMALRLELRDDAWITTVLRLI